LSGSYEKTKPMGLISFTKSADALSEKAIVPAVKTEIGVVGAGRFANKVMLPILKKKSNLVGIATRSGINSIFADDDFQFQFATTIPNRLIEGRRVNTIFVLTRPNFHAKQVIQALKSGKHVFVEIPLAISLGELEEICRSYNALPSPRPLLMIGFNRRFAPAIVLAKAHLNDIHTRYIQIRVHSHKMPADHWAYDAAIGGGRIISEVCPYIDLAIYLTNSEVLSVHTVSSITQGIESLNISIVFKNGSNAIIYYIVDSDSKLPDEQIEIKSGDQHILINDFKTVEILSLKRKKRIRFRKDDHGYEAEVLSFIRAIEEGKISPIPFEEIVRSMIITFRVNTSLRENKTVTVG
jgi:predicted dehydrogenase